MKHVDNNDIINSQNNLADNANEEHMVIALMWCVCVCLVGWLEGRSLNKGT